MVTFDAVWKRFVPVETNQISVFEIVICSLEHDLLLVKVDQSFLVFFTIDVVSVLA